MLIEFHVGGLNGESASMRHRVARIYGQIHDDLLDLAGIGVHLSGVTRQVET